MYVLLDYLLSCVKKNKKLLCYYLYNVVFASLWSWVSFTYCVIPMTHKNPHTMEQQCYCFYYFLYGLVSNFFFCVIVCIMPYSLPCGRVSALPIWLLFVFCLICLTSFFCFLYLFCCCLNYVLYHVLFVSMLSCVKFVITSLLVSYIIISLWSCVKFSYCFIVLLCIVSFPVALSYFLLVPLVGHFQVVLIFCLLLLFSSS